nr:nuclear pore complex protein NUP1-like isoform X2 [Tanacetum cinerariifolium]
MHGSVSGYANVPTKSTQTASKILQHVEKMDLKEKSSGSIKSPTKRTLDMLHGYAVRSLEKRDSSDSALAADIVATSILPGVSRTPALVKPPQKKCAFQMSAPEDDSFGIDDALVADIPVSSSEIDVGFGGSVSEHGLGFKLPASPPLTTNTQNNLLMDNVVPEKDLNSFPLFGTSAERVSLFAFSASGPSDSKPSASSDPKALESTSVSNLVTTNGHAKLIESNKVENENDQKTANIFGKKNAQKSAKLAESRRDQQPTNIFGISESKDGKRSDQKVENVFGNLDAPASTAPTNGIFSFGTTTSSLFNFSSPHVSSTSIASTDTTTTVISTTTTLTHAVIFSTSTPTPVIPSSVPAPVFSFWSATSTTPTISEAENGNTSVTNDKDLKSNLANSPFASTPISTTTTSEMVVVVEIGVLAKGELVKLDFKSLSFVTLVFPVSTSEIVGVVEVADQKLKTGAGTDEGITGVGVEVEKIATGVGVVVLDITMVVVSVLAILMEETCGELKLKSELVVVPNENIPFVSAVEAGASKFPNTFSTF